MAHRTQTGCHLHPHDTGENGVVGLRKLSRQLKSFVRQSVKPRYNGNRRSMSHATRVAHAVYAAGPGWNPSLAMSARS